MTSKIIKTTSKGQITLPKEWRGKFNTDNFILMIGERQIIIKPISLDQIESDEVLFDADRDNQGKGIPVDEMIKMLKKIQNE